MKMGRPLVLIHGYSDSAKGFIKWRDALIKKRDLDEKVVLINCITLANEVTIGDIAEGFNVALQQTIKEDEDFDVIVHSTGMLVIRAWLTWFAPIGVQDENLARLDKDQSRTKRLRHLIALAPATNGSPLAHKGRSWLGVLTKGNKECGPDFFESGHQVLSASELASSFTWDLAERDMFGNARFKKSPESPFDFTICGDPGLGEVADFATELGFKIGGSDGVVRWAGASLICRRLTVDYTGEIKAAGDDTSSTPSLDVSDWNNQDNILVLWPGLNHGTVMQPNEALIDLVSDALDVEMDEAFNTWNERAQHLAVQARGRNKPPHKWQQIVIRVVDERGDGVTEWTIRLLITMKNHAQPKSVKIDDLHPYENDKSYRCLHLDLTTM